MRGLSLPALALLGLALSACATAPTGSDAVSAALAEKASRALPASSPSPGQAKGREAATAPVPAGLPELSPSLRASPPGRVVLVISLPEPSPPIPSRPDPAASLRASSGAPVPTMPGTLLAEPLPPPTFGPIPAPKAGAALASPAQAKQASAPQAPIPKGTPGPTAGSPSPSPAPAQAPAPASASPSPPLDMKSNPKATLIPPYPNSLVPYVDVTASPNAPRSFSVEAGGKVEIPFTGTGWTYLGERDGKDGILYDSRRFEGRGALFTIAGAKVGEYSLRFMRQDLEKGTTEEELVRVSIVPKGSLAAAAAPQPAAPQAVASQSPPPVAAPNLAVSPASPVSTAQQAEASKAPAPPPSPNPGAAPSPAQPQGPEALLATARKEFAAGNPAAVIAALAASLAVRPEGGDELFWLWGQALELNGPDRDVKKALEMYRRVIDGWPRSPFWARANERIAWIERHYLDIR